MITDETTTLDALSRRVGEMAGEQQKISGLNFPSEPHEDARVKDERCEKKARALPSCQFS